MLEYPLRHARVSITILIGTEYDRWGDRSSVCQVWWQRGRGFGEIMLLYTPKDPLNYINLLI